MSVVTKFRALIGLTMLNEIARQCGGVPDATGHLYVKKKNIDTIDIPRIVDAVVEAICDQSPEMARLIEDMERRG